MNTVELSVRSKLLQIVDELGAIGDKGKQTSDELSKFSENVGKTTEKQLKKTENFLGKLRGLAGRVAHEMSEDFKALFAVAGVAEGLKLGNTFRDNIKQTFELSDAIRKMASVFGISGDRFVAFQTRLTQGLGEIGLSSESAVSALKGLSETQVRGEDQLLEYSKLAGQLSSIGGQKGQEGAIAKGMAGVLTAQGKNPNDIGNVKTLADDLRKSFNATGASPTDMLRSIEQIMAKMPTDFRKTMTTGGVASLGTTSAVAGPNATKFLEEYLSKGSIARSGLEARGFKGVFGPQGLDIEKFKKAASGIMKDLPSDPRLMAQTLGLSEDAAEGFVRLYESLDKVDQANKKMAKDNRDLTSQYQASMTAAESFNASLNKLKASLAQPLAATTNFITDGLQKAFKTSLDDVINLLPAGMQDTVRGAKKGVALPDALDKNLGSTAVVAGAGVMTALLAGGGIKKLMSFGQGKGQGIAERAAFEAVTGAKVQDVYVVNAGEIGSAASTGAGAGGTGVGAVAKVGGVLAAGAAGYEVGSALFDPESFINQWMNKNFPSVGKANAKIDEVVNKGIGWIAEKTTSTPKPEEYQTKNQPQNQTENKGQSSQQRVDVRVQVDTKTKDLKATVMPTRGASQ